MNAVSVLNMGLLGEDTVLPSLGELDRFCLQKVAPMSREKRTSVVGHSVKPREFCSVAGSLLCLSVNIYWGYGDRTNPKWEL